MKNIYLIFLYILINCILSLESNATDNKEFVYEKQIFCLNTDTYEQRNHLSLDEICKKAGERRAHFKELYSFVSQHQFKLPTQKLFEKEVHYVQQKLDTIGIHKNIHILSRLKIDYLIERDLVVFFHDCLEKFINSQNTDNDYDIHELYGQAIYVVRKNIKSLVEQVTAYLNYYAVNLNASTGNLETLSTLRGGDVLPEDLEYLHYSEFEKKFSKTAVMRQNTIEIEDMAYFLLKKPEVVMCPIVIWELNSILFYLNIERTLLDLCPALSFDPDKYDLDDKTDIPAKRFVLSKLYREYFNGSLASLVSGNGTRDTLAMFSKVNTQNNMLVNICRSNPTQFTQPFFEKIFPPDLLEIKPQPTPKGQTATGKATPSKKKENKYKKPQTPQKSQKPQRPRTKEPEYHEPPSDRISSSNMNKEEQLIRSPLVSFHISKPLYYEDLYRSIFKHLDTVSRCSVACTESFFNRFYNDKFLIKTPSKPSLTYLQVALAKANSTLPKIHIEPSITPYFCRIAYGDHVYTRHVTKRLNAHYLIGDYFYSFPNLSPFPLDLLEQATKCLYSERNLSSSVNLASYRLRFHYTIGNQTDIETYEVLPEELYCSGAKYFNEQDRWFKEKHHIVTAYETILTQDEQQVVKDKSSHEKNDYITKIIQKKLRDKLTKDHRWEHSILDSEPILLLDCTNNFPKFLNGLLMSTEESITLHGVALCLLSYRDSCFLCRNLIQCFQWGLQDLIQHTLSTFGGNSKRMRLSENFATVAITAGQIPCVNFGGIHRNVDAINPKAPMILGVEGQKHRGAHHKLGIVQLTRDESKGGR